MAQRRSKLKKAVVILSGGLDSLCLGAYLAKKYDKFFNIVELYEIGEYPDNVTELDHLSSEVDNQSLRLSEIADALEDLITMTEKISKYNKDLFTKNYNI